MLQVFAKTLPFAALLGAAVYLFTLTLHFDFPRAPDRLGPDVWPQAILVLLILTCAAGICRTLLADRRAKSGPGEGSTARAGEAGAAEPEVPSRYGLVAGGVLLFLAYPVALEHLGFLAATFGLMMLFMLIGQWRNIPGVIAVSAIGTLALFYIFRGVVYVSLPLGRGLFHDWTVWIASLLGMR
ncbi:MAG: tripartite tricarboxylate transporter TctB family protein [Hyphomonadaceae bacterium]|nr:tripartite tricarboxylate transporter TctB family protein [Hyphomonadaceae bacterium]